MTPTATPLLPQPVAHPARNLDHWAHAQWAHLTGGVSTVALQLAFMDWLLHLSRNPGQMAELRVAAGQEAALLAQELVALHASAVAPQPPLNVLQDRRFADPAWQTWPFNLYSQAFLRTQAWWQRASTGVRGVSKHHEDVVSFTLRQLLDTLSPANQVATNPVVLQRMVHTGGASLWQGFQNYQDDMQLLRAQAAPLGTDAYPVGTVVATSPGQVVFRNRLIELIQYTPSGGSVHPEPILMVPAWIMKYYILDLSPGNSLVKYLVDQGFTVFVVSWTNPTAHDRDLGMDDYLRMGVMEALEAVCTVVPNQKVHAVGYCLGGTLLSMAAAAMGGDGDGRLASLTLLAAQTDFSEPGELALFIDESQIALLEDSMWDKGYLDNQQMAGAFQMISSTDLVWSRMLHDYLMGQRTPVGDVMAWNADGTRLPYRMHTEYLRSLYLHNDLARGRYPVRGKPVALTDIGCPIFCVGTVRDHVAPWRSVYKLHLLSDVELTFLLTSGGHNVGIVNPPGVPHRSYQVQIRQQGGKFVDPDTWLATTPEQEGSWWPVWADWLQARSGPLGALPSMGAEAQGLPPLCPAPGTYVLQK